MARGVFSWTAPEPVEVVSGGSGYFSTPSASLDPHLFTGGSDEFRPEIKDWILSTLYSYWDTKYNEPRAWSTVWIAGSGISYQWDANRGNGDLDVLIGVDFPLFFRYNDRFLGFSEDDMADIFNSEFHAELWPKTAETEFSSSLPNGLKQQYEVTFYVNPRSADIRDIQPYAAFNLTANEWTVRPPDAAATSHADVPRAYWDAIEDERRYSESVVSRFNSLAEQAKGLVPNSPGWHNVNRQLEIAESQAKALFDDIHLGRRQAFGPGGSGYGDYYNFRWQAHKRAGTAQALHALAASGDAVREQQATDLYGAPVDAADVVLRRAAGWNRGGNGH